MGNFIPEPMGLGSENGNMFFMYKFLNYAASVFLVAAVALIGWNLQKTTALSSNVEVIIERVNSNRDANSDDHRRIENMLMTMIPRKEAEMRMAQIETKLSEIETRLAEVQLELRKKP